MLEIFLDKIDDLSDELKGHYKEVDGKFMLQANGLKTAKDLEALNSSLTASRKEYNDLKKRVELLGDKKIEDVVKQLDKFPELEALAASKGTDEEAIEKLVEAKIQGRIAPVERERDKLKKEMQDAQIQVKDLLVERKNYSIEAAVRDAALKAGIRKEALPDAMLLGRSTFDVNDSNAIVVRDNAGFTPGIDPESWFNDLKDSRPHWWGDSKGSGAQGNRNMETTGNNPWDEKNWNMTEQVRVLAENPDKAAKMAAAAGVDVGGLKPRVVQKS